MKNIINEIKEKYLVDGENERYATLYHAKDEILEEMDVDTFEEKFGLEIDNLRFPIITFDNQSSTDGIVFGADDDKDNVLEIAKDYFDRK